MSVFICDGSCSGDDLGDCTHGIEAVDSKLRAAEARVKELAEKNAKLGLRVTQLESALASRTGSPEYLGARFEAAKAALTGLLAKGTEHYRGEVEDLAVHYADALIAALEKGS